MFKKITVHIMLLFCLLNLCSCYSRTKTFPMQKNINFNYNNVGNYTAHFWLTNDSICYIQGELFPWRAFTDTNSTKKIESTDSFGIDCIQRHENKIYFLDHVDSIDDNLKYKLKTYDTESKKRTTICSLINCDGFFVLNSDIYYLQTEWIMDDEVTTLKRITQDRKEHIVLAEDVISFGVIKNSLHYVINEKNKAVIYKYNKEDGKAVRLGEFLPEFCDIEVFEDSIINISFTEDYILFSCYSEKTKASILKYSFKDNDLKNISFDKSIDEFVSYNTNSYFFTYSQDAYKSELYKMNNDTNEIKKIAEFDGMINLFVGSDEGAYVSTGKNLAYCSNNGELQIIFQY